MIGPLARPARVFGFVALLLVCAPAFGEDGATVTVLDPTVGDTTLTVTLDRFDATPLEVDGLPHQALEVEGLGAFRAAGQPDLPRARCAVVIPDERAVRVEVVATRYHDLPGVLVPPSRGPIPRTQDPGSVPYERGPTYAVEGFWPAALATLGEPFVLRDVRGVVVDVNLFQYDPVRRVLRVHEEVELRVVDAGPGTTNLYRRGSAPDRRDRVFQSLQAQVFVNVPPPSYGPAFGSGDLLIIAHGPFQAALQPLIDWRNAHGIQTTCVDVAVVGNTPASIAGYIQSTYAAGNLASVLLVGDHNHVASPTYSGGLSDPSYTLMDGDWYPDILVGRFSANSVADVQTQVQRTLEYEQQDHTLGAAAWNARGLGIASNQGPGHNGEYDNQHMDLIRGDLMGEGFTDVDRVYDPSGTKAQITAALDEGRRLVHYCGHGSTTSWGTTGFSNWDVDQLANVGTLPLVHSVACVNGQFDNGTCFGEAWLRATDAGQPTGAVGAYMSTINQYWNEPMWAQDETVDLFCAEGEWSMGGLWFAGSILMMNVCGQSGRDMFMTWTCFGDPTLTVLGDGACAEPTRYCTAAPNSVGPGAGIGHSGSLSIAAGDLALNAGGCPPNKGGMFFYGTGRTQTPVANGFLCIGGGYVRLPPVQTDVLGNAVFPIDYGGLPANGQITAGSTWCFQFWYRDPAGGGAGSNLTDALEATFCP